MKVAKHKLKPRNPVARSPLLSKGGVHQKTRGALRRKEKRELAQEIRNLPEA